MRKALARIYFHDRFKKLTFLFSCLLFSIIGYAQPCDPITLPPLFGGGVPTYIYCKDEFIRFGVNISKLDQMYDFSVYKNGVQTSRKGGPLDGNGNTLSVAAFMRSVPEAGEYRITIFNRCGDTASFSFYVFSSNINNLSIASWGSNSVTAKWAASGLRPAVTYEYAITPIPDPYSSSITYQATTDTTASATGLTSGTTYYIHVRVKQVSLNGDPIGTFYSDSRSPCFNNLPFESIRFVSCSGAASIGSLTPVNAIRCVGENVTLTASGGNSYTWYDNSNNLISGANSSTCTVSSAGQYRAYITTPAGCEGMAYSARITDTLLHAAIFSGGGTYCLNDTVKLGLSRTLTSQTYTILKDGSPVYTMQGIGFDLQEFDYYEQSEDTIWYKFKITSAAQTGTYTVRTTNAWCSSNLTFGNNVVSTSSAAVTNLITTSVKDRSVNFKWTYPASWQYKFEYAVTTSATPPASGTFTTNFEAFADALSPSTTYRIHVRPVCAQGALSWTTISFTTLSAYVLCSSTPSISACTTVTQYIPTGTGSWNFTGTYPNNSDGGATPGRERVFNFTPSQTGVYYIDVTAASGNAIHYLYKLASNGCNSTGWTGIRAISASGKYPIGMLQSGTQYLFVLDNSDNTIAASQTFKICRATVTIPSRLNECIYTASLPATIPAFSTKEEYIIDEGGNLVASLDFSGVSASQNNIDVSYFVNGDTTRKDRFQREYLDRDFHVGIYSPVGAKVKLFFTDAELQRLINDPDDGIADVTSINDLLSTNDGDCSFLSSLSNSFVPQISNGDYDATSHFVVFYNSSLGNYYLHGGNINLNYQKQLDYGEDFESVNFPAGWTQQFVSPTIGSLAFVQTSGNPPTNPYSGAWYVKFDSWDFPAGTETRLVSPPLSTAGANGKNLKIEFYWFNENNTAWNAGHYLNEGVQVQYSFNGIDWTDAGAFIPRHDASLPEGTGQWKKKKVALPLLTGTEEFCYVAFKFRSEYGDNCSLDSVMFKWAPGCDSVVSGLSTTSILSNSVNFHWNPVVNAVNYEYKVEGGPPYVIIPNETVPVTNGSATYLENSTTYQISVRPACTTGIFGDWKTIQFTTPAGPSYCLDIPSIEFCSQQTTTIPAGIGEWNFAGVYPKNSAGWPTPGKEQIFSFTPDEAGVYYIDILPGSDAGWVDYLYKPAYTGCNNRDWIGIDDVFLPGKRPIGWLDAGTTYLLLLDNENTASVTKIFKICKATVGSITSNTCVGIIPLADSIPAGSEKPEYILDNNGNLIAGLYFGNLVNSPGYVDLSFYINNGPVRRDVGNREYLDRNFTIRTTHLPTENRQIEVQLFFTNAELQRLIDEPNDGIADVSSIDDLAVTRLMQDCSATLSGVSSLMNRDNFVFEPGTYDENSSSVGFRTKALATFYIHGGDVPIEANNILCPSAGSTAFSFLNLGYSVVYQWQVDTGSGFQNVSDNNVYSGAKTSYLAFNNPPTSFNGYKYRCVATYPGLPDSTIGASKTLKFVVTWNGSISSSWHNPSNWDCGVVPDANTDVIIENTGFAPMISSNVSCRSVFVKQGSNITVSPGAKLTVTGH